MRFTLPLSLSLVFGCAEEGVLTGAPEPIKLSDQVEKAACGDVDYRGQCEGDVAVWCNHRRLARHDCGRRGQTCGWHSDEFGYACL